MDTPALAPSACFVAFHLRVNTTRPREFIDITPEVEYQVSESGVSDGLVVIASRHTTAAIVVNEHEPELLKDLDRMLGEIAPVDKDYFHNGVPCGKGEHPNGHAHCQALMMSSSASLPIVNGTLLLGRYQRIFLVELDGARTREVTIALLGQ
jgi:secondary thiamine-phosphate synthase enzyme